jgi:glycyl-tRNA synthetase beta subunit
MSQKTERVRRLCGLFAKELGGDESLVRKLDRAAILCKADLATQMVMELPSLQGKIGREYALLDGEDVEVAEAVGEQYTGVPRGRLGKLLALADRLDSLGALYASGARPSGAGDPLGLRRLAQTSVEIELALSEECPGFRIHSQHLSLTETALKEQGLEVGAAAQEVEAYLVERFRGILLDNGVRYDVADAVSAGRLRENRGVAIRVARLLEDRRRQGDAGYLALAQAASRVGNILVQAEKKGLQFQEVLPSPANFKEEAELALHKAVDSAQKNGEPSVADEAFEQLTRLIPPITHFFDQVMVMCDDETLRSLRLSLLAALRREFMKVADFSKLVQDMESRAA